MALKAVVAAGQIDRVVEVRRVLLGEGLDCPADCLVTYEGLPACLAAHKPALVFVCFDGPMQEALATIGLAHQLAHGKVLAIGPASPAAMRDALQAGASEYLDVADLRQGISAVVTQTEVAAPGESKRGQIVSIYASTGGLGSSTVAINLAAALHRQRPEGSSDVALVDLTPAPSDLSLLLDLEPKHELPEVCRHWEHLDRKMMEGAMTTHTSGLLVLPQAGFDTATPDAPGLTARIVRQMCILLRRTFEAVVLDLGHAMSEVEIEAMRMSNLVILPVAPDVPGVRRVRWVIELLAEQGIERERFFPVVTRFAGRHQLSKAKVQEALGIPVFSVLPDSIALATRARNEGVTQIELSGKYRSLYRAMARKIIEHAAGATA